MNTNAIYGSGISHYNVEDINNAEMSTIVNMRNKVRKCRQSFKTEKKEYLNADDYDLLDAILTQISWGAEEETRNSIMMRLEEIKCHEEQQAKAPTVAI